MNIAIDIMGGDYAPAEIVAGALAAAAETEKITLVGHEETLAALAPLPDNVAVVVSKTVMAMDEPVDNLRRKRDSSIFVATKLVADGEADAVVSAGSTAAQMAAALLLFGRISGVKRPAISIPYPTLAGDKLMLDAGANPEAAADNLLDFAALGHCYAKYILGIENPRVALLSNGAESHKGTAAIVEAHQQLQQMTAINFIGNVEARDMTKGDYDVVVTDGFSGNVVLKLTEGVASSLFKLIKEALTATTARKIGGALVKPGLASLKERFDYSAYGGAPLLGVKGVSIICHGSSRQLAIKNAVKTARECLNINFIDKISDAMSAIKK